MRSGGVGALVLLRQGFAGLGEKRRRIATLSCVAPQEPSRTGRRQQALAALISRRVRIPSLVRKVVAVGEDEVDLARLASVIARRKARTEG